MYACAVTPPLLHGSYMLMPDKLYMELIQWVATCIIKRIQLSFGTHFRIYMLYVRMSVCVYTCVCHYCPPSAGIYRNYKL